MHDLSATGHKKHESANEFAFRAIPLDDGQHLGSNSSKSAAENSRKGSAVSKISSKPPFSVFCDFIPIHGPKYSLVGYQCDQDEKTKIMQQKNF